MAVSEADRAVDAGRYLAQSAVRNAVLDRAYDPISGTGSEEPRRVVLVTRDGESRELSEEVTLAGKTWLPEVLFDPPPFLNEEYRVAAAAFAELIDEHGSMEAAATALKQTLPQFLVDLGELRCVFDPEYWLATRVTIRSSKGMNVPFVLRRAQRKYLRTFLRLLWAGMPVRIVLLKARQWGGSTLTQLAFAWVQLFHRRGWNSAIVTQVQSQAGHILGMYETMAEEYPEKTHPQTVTLRPYRRTQTVRLVVETDSYIAIGSVERPDNLRAFTFHMIHMSEVGLWQSTPKVNAEDLAQSLEGGLASGRTDEPFTIVVKESTARGVGTYFHRVWQESQKDGVGEEPVFIPWFEIAEDRQKLESYAAKDVAAFVRSWTPYERKIWTAWNGSLEQIRWYREKLNKGFRGKHWRMQSEYPSEPHEAFQSTGNRYFNYAALKKARLTVRPPLLTGNMRGKGDRDKTALLDLRFIPTADVARDAKENPVDCLQVWHPPDEKYVHPLNGGPRLDLEGGKLRVTNRFVAFADPGGKRDTADYSVLKIIDRLPMIWAEPVRVAAVWRGHLRPDLFAWVCAQVCTWYDNALLAPEINRNRKQSGDEERGFEPEWSMAVLEEIADVYPNFYLRQKEGRLDAPHSMEIGFHMNQLTKPLIISQLDAAMEDGLYVEASENACDEADTYEANPDGTLGAVTGCYDDELVATAGVIHLAIHYDGIAAVKLVPVRNAPIKGRGRVSRF